tara:strand:+ start:512 stop:1282 length:771 start_codon:yes stop_codon:yes gene_type:complete
LHSAIIDQNHIFWKVINMFVLILGLGRTGRHLSALLKNQGHQVAGTTTRADPELAKKGVIPIIWSSGHGTQALPDADCIVCAFPPNDFYPVQLAALVMRYPNKRIIQISSTGVFGANQGKIDESTHPIANCPRSQLLLEAEMEILKHPTGQIVRAGGLYDEENHPISFLAGKKEIKNPLGKINLIHRQDLAEIIFDLIVSNQEHKITHAVNPEHPTREEYYLTKAKEFDLATPEFEKLTSESKEVKTRLQRQWRKL